MLRIHQTASQPFVSTHWVAFLLKKIEPVLLPGILRVCFFIARCMCPIWKISLTWRIWLVLQNLHTTLGESVALWVPGWGRQPGSWSFCDPGLYLSHSVKRYTSLLPSPLPFFHIPHTNINECSDVTGCGDKFKGTITRGCFPLILISFCRQLWGA